MARDLESDRDMELAPLWRSGLRSLPLEIVSLRAYTYPIVAKCNPIKIAFATMVDAKSFALTAVNAATFRSVILQTKFPSIDCLVAQPHLSSSHRDLPSARIIPPSHRTATAQQLPPQLSPGPKFANREMTTTPRTGPKTNWKILKATGTVQYNPTFA